MLVSLIFSLPLEFITLSTGSAEIPGERNQGAVSHPCNKKNEEKEIPENHFREFF